MKTPDSTAQGLRLAQVSSRYGIKGADAAAWLAGHGVPVPDAPNRARHWDDGRCLRLGSTEFLVEHDGAAPSAARNESDVDDRRAWVLLRSDHSLILTGSHWPVILSQACSFDFEHLRTDPGLVVMTVLAGISVTLVREPSSAPDAPFALRLWCDASYAIYLDQSLQQLASPLGEQR